MRLNFLAVVLLAVIFPVTKAQDTSGPEARAFRVSPLDTPFAVQGDFEGDYRIYPNGIEVKITKAEIRVSEHCPYKGRRLLSSVKFGLATAIDDKGRWKIVTAAQELVVDRVVQPGDSFSLGELYFYIPTTDSIDLSKHWLAVQIGDNVMDVPSEKKRKGYAFAHSCRDLFTKK